MTSAPTSAPQRAAAGLAVWSWRDTGEDGAEAMTAQRFSRAH